MAITVVTKRVYEPADADEGYRILVDRVWPRGMNKEQVSADLWLKDVAPSTALRKWFGHDPARWVEFKRRYFQELDENPTAVAALIARAGNGPLVLLFSARDTEHNQAAALKEYLLSRLEGRDDR